MCNRTNKLFGYSECHYIDKGIICDSQDAFVGSEFEKDPFLYFKNQVTSPQL